MNEKIKTFFIRFFTVIAGFFAIVFGAILQSKRNTIDGNRDRVDELEREATNQQSANKRAAEQARREQSNNGEAVSRIDEATSIIREIREKQKIVEDDNVLDGWYCCELFDNNNNSNNIA